MFDKVKFLSLRLNEGYNFEGDGSSEDCGCIKGNFAKSCGFFREIMNGTMGMQELMTQRFPKLQTALDICEYILIKGYPQKAKLLFVELVEKYGVLPQDFSIRLIELEKFHVSAFLKSLQSGDSVVIIPNASTHTLSIADPYGHSIPVIRSKYFTPAVSKVKTRLTVNV